MTTSLLTCRPAVAGDAVAIVAIYNEGIADRIATFETEPRRPEQIQAWLVGRHPIVVVEQDGRVIAWAACSAYRSRACYAGVAEFSVYVARSHRGRGAGRVAMAALMEDAAAAGLWKLVSRVFVENAASRLMLRRLGFREVGVYERHARLDGAWRDVVIVEALLGDAAGATVARELPAGDRAGLAAALATAGLPATDLAAPTCASGSSPIAAARSSAMPGSRPRAATRCSAPSSWSVRAARAPDGRSSTRPPAGPPGWAPNACGCSPPRRRDSSSVSTSPASTAPPPRRRSPRPASSPFYARLAPCA
jgi:L-amino acid N-acyltransferase YncA